MRAALDTGASPFDLGLKITGAGRPAIVDLDAAGLSMIQFA